MISAWAKDILKSSAIILDTETTGVGKDAQVIQISIVDMAGKTLFDSLLKPTCEIHPMATATHHLTKYHLRSSPTFSDVHEVVKSTLEGHPVIIYNKSFDLRMICQTAMAFGLDAGWVDGLDAQCAMRAYADFLGVKSAPKLDGGDHSALGDCLATLKLLRLMAGITEEPKILKEPETQSSKAAFFTVSAPPARLITWALKSLQARIDKGEYPPAGWVESLQAIQQAQAQTENIQLELIAKDDFTRIVQMDPLDITAYVGATINTDQLMLLQSVVEQRYGESWTLLAEQADGELWRVEGLRTK